MELSKKQEAALKAVVEWFNNWDPDKKPFFYLGGFAGCGKTTLAEFIEREIASKPGRIVRCAFTGKAAMRLQQTTGKAASTIHSCIYHLVEDPKSPQPQFELNTKDSPFIGAKLVELDECSMVNEEMGEDILSFKVPVLVLGDPGQLPPPKGTGFFTKRKPDVMLTEVHRQALDSPILRLATDIRNGKNIGRMNEPDCLVYPFSKDYDLEQEMLLADQMLTGKNVIRESINHRTRRLRGFTDTYPEVGDKLICIKNQRNLNLFNGLLGNVTQVKSADMDRVLLDIETEIGERKDVEIIPECFTDMETVQGIPFRDRREFSEFDWGYCLTVHKSQGSQWDSVLLLDDGFLNWKKEERGRWLYTAVTRAAKRLVVLNRRS